MAMRAGEDEKAIVNAFLRNGHPWLAFGTVVLRSGVRIAIATALMLLTMEHGSRIQEMLNSLPIPL